MEIIITIKDIADLLTHKELQCGDVVIKLREEDK